MLSVLLGLAMQASLAAAPSVEAPAHIVTDPEWIRRPTGADLNRLYPMEAARNEKEGRAVITCKVNGEGLLVDCAVIEEAPIGLGFGEAALKMSTRFQMRPKTRDGQSVEGGSVRIPMRFAVPGRIDPLSAMYACYGLSAAELERDPANEEARHAFGIYVAQAGLIASKNRSTPAAFEAGLAEARRAAADPTGGPQAGPTLKTCLAAATPAKK